MVEGHERYDTTVADSPSDNRESSVDAGLGRDMDATVKSSFSYFNIAMNKFRKLRQRFAGLRPSSGPTSNF